MNNEIKEKYLKAKEIAYRVKKEAKDFIKRDCHLVNIAEFIEKRIIEIGGKTAFPANLSIDEVAAHYTPSLNDEKKAEGLLKIDFGVEVDGYIWDLAFSIDLTEEKKYEEMIKLNEEILNEAIKSINKETRVCDIGKKISELLKRKKFNIIKNLSGHSLERYLIHGGVTIPNVENKDDTLLFGKAIAIEPFLTTGIGEVIEGKPSEIFMLIDERKKPRDNETRKILEFIKKEYKTKPFCKRWLDKEGFKTSFPLKILTKEKILYNFPVLIEKSRGIVSQAEESVIVI